MPPANLDTLRDAAQEIAVEVGALLLEGHRRGGGETHLKGPGGDLVTEYDTRAEALLRSRLGALTPDATVVGEESGGQSSSRCWYVDPIDGTGNFAHGHPWFCVSLGLFEAGEPRVGVVHAPAMKVTYAAARGSGTFRLSAGEAPTRVSVSKTTALSDCLLATGFPRDRATRPDNNYAAFMALDSATHGVRRCAAAALELAVLAEGGYDGFWDRGLGPWDVAAAIVLIQEAGGSVTDLEGAPLALRFPAQSSYDIVATNGLIHASLRDALAHGSDLLGRPKVP